MTPSGRVSREHLSDETLIGQMRTGDREAYAELWRRHFRAGLRAARSFAHLEDPDDLVAEAFTRILLALQAGTGPTVSFRPYLYTTIRNLALRRVHHLAVVQDVDLDTIVDPDTEDPEIEHVLDRSLTVTAFRALPERWQTVLWYTEVERMTPAQAGALLGLSANATSALAFRARAALRAAWLQAHVADDTLDEDCRNALKHLGEYTQGTLSRRETQRVRDHLDTCTRCSIIAGDVDHVAGRLAIIMLPLVLGGAAALAFAHALAGAAGAGASVATAASIPAIPPVPNPTAAGAAASTTAAAGSSASAFTTIALIAAGAVVVAGAGVVGVVAITSATPSTHQAGRSTSDTNPGPGPTTSVDHTSVAVPVIPDPAVPVAPIVKVTTPPVAPVVASVVTPVPPVLPVLDSPTIDPTPMLVRVTTALFSGTGTPGAEIEASAPAPDVGIPVAPDGTWQWKDSALVEGVNTISFVQHEEGYQDSAAVSVVVTVDTIAPAPPVIASTWSNTQTTSPQFTGTAEPLAEVALSDQDGDLLETVTADAAGDWTSGVVPGLEPTGTELSVVQTDAAGNRSAAAIVGPFAFVPVITSPVDGSVMSPQTVPLVITGWAGESVLISLDGGGAQTFSFDTSGELDLTIMSGSGPLATGSYTVAVRYGTGSPAATVNFTIS
jgi:RNA polymerase sigma factor (sigma-70 family)